MSDAIELRTDGPHSPDYTRVVGNALAEAVRVLNYATRGDALGLHYPSDADRLLHDITTAFDRMPQLLEQVRAWLRARSHAGRIGDDLRGDPGQLAEWADLHLLDAITSINTAAEHLRSAAARTSHMTDTTPGDSDA